MSSVARASQQQPLHKSAPAHSDRIFWNKASKKTRSSRNTCINRNHTCENVCSTYDNDYDNDNNNTLFLGNAAHRT